LTAPDVLVVGAGVLGASAAYHLAAAGAKVTLLEREPETGRGSTGRATGGFRAQYATSINVRLSLLSREKLLRFREELGADPGYAQAGYLWLARTPAQRDELRAAQELQRSLGLAEARMVEPAEAARLNPAIAVDEEVCGGAFCPTDGFIRPLDILRGYLKAAQRLGARLLRSVRLEGFDRAPDGSLAAARTDQGALHAGAFVDAAGPWAAQVARLAGLHVPVSPLRRQVAATVPTSALPSSMPMTLWSDDGFHLRVRDGRVLLLLPTPGDPRDPFATSVEGGWLERVGVLARRRVPALGAVPLDPTHCWAGLYEMSPDKHAILGAFPECPNFHVLAGASGHGVMHAPALGQLLAESIIHGRARALDVAALRPTRFAEGDLNPSGGLL
jgi:sarcosine oxidase subunit beta